jgi:hypothetical protein
MLRRPFGVGRVLMVDFSLYCSCVWCGVVYGVKCVSSD